MSDKYVLTYLTNLSTYLLPINFPSWSQIFLIQMRLFEFHVYRAIMYISKYLVIIEIYWLSRNVDASLR